ncbi:hypothetical protein L211DRAFT_450735 [Terfezia boudieri ATCC MYA-4762]|uniref:Uncharacterized protein n=1 Tax=Terfezia boudieri ATCC MYA-4762 TaxID=1051890 RepID=A0A3N4LI98_9PEZI|nr:hypothetical protein L211DRAFT_450735 [Terfezia boudieri ATCC MYA-4762]
MNQLKSFKDRLPGRDRSGSSSGAGANTITGLGLRTKASSFVSSKTPSFLGSTSGTSSSTGTDYAPARPLTALRDQKEFAPPPKRQPTMHRPGSGSHQQWQGEGEGGDEDNHTQSQFPQPALPPRRLRADTEIPPFKPTLKKRPPPPPPPKRLNSYTSGSGSVRDPPTLPPAGASTEPAAAAGGGGKPPPLPPRLPPRPPPPGSAAMPRRGTIPPMSIRQETDKWKIKHHHHHLPLASPSIQTPAHSSSKPPKPHRTPSSPPATPQKNPPSPLRTSKPRIPSAGRRRRGTPDWERSLSAAEYAIPTAACGKGRTSGGGCIP